MAKRAAKKKAAKKATTRKAPARRKPAAKAGISPAPKKASAGRPAFRPTDEHRKQVETLVGLGLKQDDICLLIMHPKTGQPLTGKTLRRHFEHELKIGALKANAKVAESLFLRATKGEGPGAVTAAIFWSKVRMGWKERTVVEVESKSGVLVPPGAMTPAEWIEAANKRAENAKEPGAEETNGNGMNGNGDKGGDKVTR